jgi:septal ring factor EnvC (AmiA/AmiB activator)
VWVPAAALAPRQTGPQTARHDADAAAPLARAVAALEGAIATLTTQLSKAEARADRAEAEAADALQRLRAVEVAGERRKGRGRLCRAWDGWCGR